MEKEESAKGHQHRHKRQRTPWSWIGIGAAAVIIIVIAVVLLTRAHDQAAQPQPIAGQSGQAGQVLAKVNNETITETGFAAQYALFLYLQGVPASQASQVPKAAVFNDTITQMLLAQAAAANGYSVSRSQVESSLAKSLAANNRTLADLKAQIAGAPFTYDDLIAFNQRQLAINAFLNATLLGGINITDAQAKLYYEQHPSTFQVPLQIRASHILVNSSSEAEMLIKRLEAGADFAALARNYSIGPSAPNGGDLGYFARGQMVKPFEDAAFALGTVGNYTKTPVKTQYGYHIIKLTGIEPAHTLTFPEVKDRLEQQLVSGLQRQLFDSYVAKLRANANIVIYRTP